MDIHFGGYYKCTVLFKRETYQKLYIAFIIEHKAVREQMVTFQILGYYYYYYYVFILSAISPYTTGLKALFNPSDYTGTAPTHK